ncbi:TonB-dependent receptor [Campylobacter sp. FMV-PI01]|uniref:TonB-dependent receptor n=1 Tax=Campylobacter portucalensis TaxID=2608384 RepID=A0A6L5WI74_9BACT|nr:TonB-dependent receptor [Campylobacter portucalensis]MSN96968.1 TonB-dependent receptor [Campylobacter portucalensis]
MRVSFVLSCLLFSSINLLGVQKKTLESVVVEENFQQYTFDEPVEVKISSNKNILENSDIAKSLLDIPGFSMARKGGGGSEIFYRSQGASRLPVVINNSLLHGGCGGRMDTPITYISPQNYKYAKLIKGPQDVRFSSLIGGGVIFDRGINRLNKISYNANLSALYGSFNRKELNLNALIGNEFGSVEIFGGLYKSGDYKDGNSKIVHSSYDRKNIVLTATITPTDTTAVSFSAEVGKGKASYADRMMDGSKFDRNSYALRVVQDIDKHQVKFDAYYNKIDHVMDNFSLRPAKKDFMISNPKRVIKGFRLENELNFNDFKIYSGISHYKDSHISRMSGKQNSQKSAQDVIKSKPFSKNADFTYSSIFLQGEKLYDGFGIFSGLRYDRVGIKFHKSKIDKNENLYSGFLRFENYFDDLTLYAGLGVAQRAPDFWEINGKVNGAKNGYKLKKETNTQVDFGGAYRGQNTSANLNLFASRIDDYIMLHYKNQNIISFNSDVIMMGFQTNAEILLYDMLKAEAGLSYTYAKNLKNTNGLAKGDPLPQISPLSFKFSLGIQKPTWFINSEIYANASQHRYKKDYGNVVGRDLGYSDKFWTLNLNAGVKYKNYEILLLAQNLNNTLYSYHNSKNGAAISTLDIAPTTRVYEPGRSFWVKFKANF